jgi:hypothetical protein
MDQHFDARRARHGIDSGRVARGARRVLAVSALACGALVVAAGPGYADDITGGCTGTINGRDASTLTKSDPLSVKEGELIVVEGNVPAEAQNQNPNSYTTVEVDLLADVVGVSTSEHLSTGATYQSEGVAVDDYMQYGAGLYQVHVTNTGPGWVCEYTGYVKMDTDPLGTPIGIAAAGSAVVGAVGLVLAKGTKRRPRRDWFDRLLSEHERARRDDTLRAAYETDPGLRMVEEVRYAPVGPPWILATLTLPLAVMPVTGTAGAGAGVPPAVPSAAAPRVIWQQTAWKRGHAVLGFLTGGLLGIGVCVLLWQYAVWLLTVVTLFVLPVVIAIASGVYAWVGRRYRGKVTVAPSAGSAVAGDALDLAPLADDDLDDAYDDGPDDDFGDEPDAGAALDEDADADPAR